ncbi:Hypothetical protein, putative [Bodo saltans]|uniref:Uncharacterized protein n=1 Tax=Bodo saltans TaxID=75058 RepID=A0A0S4IVZ0_BODSA|nr:Hypothetical protein, putative [Bodo saltans]|eukprot:CUG03418.1 Hypothetical protein, putative [Bodo saltans]
MGSGCSNDASTVSNDSFSTSVIPDNTTAAGVAMMRNPSTGHIGSGPLASVVPQQRPVPPRASAGKNRARLRANTSDDTPDPADIAALMTVDGGQVLSARTPTRRPAVPHPLADDFGSVVDSQAQFSLHRNFSPSAAAGGSSSSPLQPNHNETDSDQVLSPNAVSDVVCRSQSSLAGCFANFDLPQSPAMQPAPTSKGSSSFSSRRQSNTTPSFAAVVEPSSPQQIYVMPTPTASISRCVLGTPTAPALFGGGSAGGGMLRSAGASTCSIDAQDPLDMMGAGYGAGNGSTTTSLYDGRQSRGASSSVAEDPPLGMYRSFHSSSTMHTTATTHGACGQSLGGSLVESVMRYCGGGAALLVAAQTTTATSSGVASPTASASRSRPLGMLSVRE